MKPQDILTQLIALREQVADIIDRLQSPAAKSKPKSPKKGPRSRGPAGAGADATQKLAIVVGHTRVDGGAEGIAPISASEYRWNSDLASLISAHAATKGVEVRTFFRDGIGVSGAYANVRAWRPRASIELHFNAANGTARGTETLFGTACAASAGWAGAIQNALVRLYARTGSQNRGLKKCPPHPRGGASVNAMSDIPSCLIEPFFGDNTADAALGHRSKRAQAQALVDAFKSHFP